MPEALVALGGNVGNSRAILDRAIGLLCDGKEVRLVARSSDYRTPPWGFKYQPHFVNLAIVVETTLGPRELLARAQEVELRLGRTRACSSVLSSWCRWRRLQEIVSLPASASTRPPVPWMPARSIACRDGR